MNKPLIKLTKRFEFTASHYIPTAMHDNACSKDHSHNFRLDLTIEQLPGVELDNGILLDTGHFKIDIAPIIAKLNGQSLNTIEGLEQPTLENFTLWFWARLGFLRNGRKFKLSTLRLYETEKFWCEIDG